MIEPKYPDVSVKLVGGSFAIIGAVSRGLRKYGVEPDEIAAFKQEAMAGDYDNLLQTALRWVDCDGAAPVGTAVQIFKAGVLAAEVYVDFEPDDEAAMISEGIDLTNKLDGDSFRVLCGGEVIGSGGRDSAVRA